MGNIFVILGDRHGFHWTSNNLNSALAHHIGLHIGLHDPARARVGAQSGLGPGPGWGPYGPIWALMGPYGPIRALMGPILFKKSLILIKNIRLIINI